jgi:DNA-binding NtrC family response regulator
MPKVLCIDDEQVILKILKLFLQDKYEVRVCEKPEEGLHLALSGEYPLIITDLRMPGMTGLEIIEALEKEEVDCKVIVMTSHPKSDEEQSRLIVNHLQKPINKQVVQEAVQSAFDSMAA